MGIPTLVSYHLYIKMATWNEQDICFMLLYIYIYIYIYPKHRKGHLGDYIILQGSVKGRQYDSLDPSTDDKQSIIWGPFTNTD